MPSPSMPMMTAGPLAASPPLTAVAGSAWWFWLTGAALIAAGIWQGAWAGAALALPGAALMAWGGLRRSSGLAGAAADPSAGQDFNRDGRSVGAPLMVRRVVPVWAQQMDVTRQAGEAGLEQLLQGFTTISERLAALTQQIDHQQPATSPGALGDAVAAQDQALQQLLQPMSRAFEQRADAVARLGDCARVLAQMQQLSREAREIGRHTRLVAFNASIEANRQSSSRDGGSQQVAAEVRTLSERVVAVCDRLDALTQGLADATAQAHRRAQVKDTNDEELRLECELRAREALQLMLGSLGGALQGTTQLREASQAVGATLDEIYTHFQFGDRVTQMLQILAQDMTRFADWAVEHPQATLGDAQAWLNQLEKSYTMDEQRANHHGHQHVDRGSEVDFF